MQRYEKNPYLQIFLGTLLQKSEENGQNQQAESHKVIPVEGLSLEQEVGDDGKYRQRNDFLNDLELDERERTAVLREAHPVGGHHKRVFEEGDSPGKEDDADERPVVRNLHLLQFQVAVPGQRHEDVGTEEKEDGSECFHVFSMKKRLPAWGSRFCNRVCQFYF